MKILVSDFDGVICDGLAEYFYSSKLVYQQIWQNPIQSWQLLQEQFNILRPVVETGWEMPLLLKVLTEGETVNRILNNWQEIREKAIITLEKEGITVKKLIQTLDEVRETQIRENLQDWLSLHSFYDGVIDTLKKLMAQKIKLYIVTTKSKIFTQELLEKQGIILSENVIIGKEAKCPKYETIRNIIREENVNAEDVSFIEDRLEALELVYQQSDLQAIKLYLALWGYNNDLIKEKAEKLSYINSLSLAKFSDLIVSH